MMEEKILAKLFPKSLKDTALEFFSSLPANSITSFHELVEAFVNHFQVHMTPKITLADLMRFKLKYDKNIIKFISRYQFIYSQINIKIPNPHLQSIFIDNLKTKIQNKLTMMNFPSFFNLCTTLCDYQNSVSSHEKKSTSS
jgi:hypothetical protein